MKKSLSVILLVLLMLTLVLSGCRGQKSVQSIITHGLKTEYELNETPSFEGVTATIVYNDETTKEVDGSELEFGTIDTSVAGKKTLTISYGGYSTTVSVTVKAKSLDITSRELVSIEYFSGLPQTIYTNDIIDYSLIKIEANYSDGTAETIDVATNQNVKHNGAEISTATAGTYTLTINYMGKTVNVPLTVNEIVLTGIEVDGNTVDTTITEGTAFDPTGMKVYALYNNGSKVFVALENLTINQSGTTVTISYQGKSTTLTLSTEPPVVTGLSITSTGYEGKTLVYGDTITTAGVLATASLNNGTTKVLANSDLVFAVPTINAAGTYTVNVSYAQDENIKASYELNILGISSIAINATNSLKKHPVDTPYNTSALTVIITCTDGTKVERSVADGVKVDSSDVKVDTVSPIVDDKIVPYKLTATYGGVVSAPLDVVVYDPQFSYFILEVDSPNSLTAFENNSSNFINKDSGYVVGDDNHFIFKLQLTVIDDNNNPVTDSVAYNSYFEIYHNGQIADSKYIDAVNPKANSVDFSEAAIGKTFTIKTRPADGVEGREAAMTREFTVTIVDGYNIYEAWELNYLTNHDTESFGKNGYTQTQRALVDAFLLEAQLPARPAYELSGAVLHNNLTVKVTDVPKEYFVGENRSGEFFDYIYVFNHINRSASGTFNFYGNYFTVFSNELPNVDAPGGDGNQSDNVSQGALFRFAAPFTSFGESDPWRHMYENYTTNINDLYIRDNNPNTDNLHTAARNMRGLFGIKLIYQEFNLNNVNLEAFYISMGIDGDFTKVNLNECTFYNSWQNHIYVWSTNETPCELTDAPADVYTAATLNINKSKVTKCGGPVIICQSSSTDQPCGAKSGAQINIDSTTEIWTWVTGTEAWFEAMGVGSIALKVASLGEALPTIPTTMGKNILSETNETGTTNADGYMYMNMIMVNLISGTDFMQLITSETDIDGKLTIGGTTYLDMTDGENGEKYGSQVVSDNQAYLGNLYEGGTIVSTCTGGALIQDKDDNAWPVNVMELGSGDYITVYKGPIGLVLGYK